MKIPYKLLLSLLLCSAASSQAAELLIYNFDGRSLSPTITASNCDAGDIDLLTANTGFATNTSSLLGNPAPGILADASGTQLNARTAADALTSNDYLSFTVTPDTNYQMNLSSFTVDAQGLNGSLGVSGSTTEYSFGLYSSIDGWASTSDMIGSPQSISFTSTVDGNEQGGFSTLTFDISSLASQTTGTEFRLYVWVSTITGTTPNNNRRLSLDNLALDGSVTAIPEPATLSLIIAGITGLTVFVRRRL
ncbi:MAG: PEP-CTERM sorting domain-containing protein [Verrucomicrobiota bacterium JB024]|nr:PEP-CTERM sorting domain-containing protein [Verrucomicrobiota bacterium JB024]